MQRLPKREIERRGGEAATMLGIEELLAISRAGWSVSSRNPHGCEAGGLTTFSEATLTSEVLAR
jgi:hypothetical protein